MHFKKHIPNFITLLNLLCGLLAIVAIFNSFYDHAFIFVSLGIFFDFWDGFFARKFNVSSALGLQLDSLADMVTSGVVPGIMMFKLLENIQNNQEIYNVTADTFYMGIVPYFGFLITIASCYRLANFNIDTRQTNSFIGLPTPANTLFIMSIPMIQYFEVVEWVSVLLDNPYVLIGITFLSVILLNAEIPLFSLKFKKLNWAEAKLPILFVLFSILMLLFFVFMAIPIIVFSYIIVSLFVNASKSK